MAPVSLVNSATLRLTVFYFGLFLLLLPDFCTALPVGSLQNRPYHTVESKDKDSSTLIPPAVLLSATSSYPYTENLHTSTTTQLRDSILEKSGKIPGFYNNNGSNTPGSHYSDSKLQNSLQVLPRVQRVKRNVSRSNFRNNWNKSQDDGRTRSGKANLGSRPSFSKVSSHGIRWVGR